jgi:hypothetical protein
MKAGANIFEEVLKKLKENPDSFTLREALTLVQYTQLEVIIFLSSLLLSGTPEALERFCRNAPHLHNLLTQSESILQELKFLHLQAVDSSSTPVVSALAQSDPAGTLQAVLDDTKKLSISRPTCTSYCVYCSRLQSNSTSHRENSDTQEVLPSDSDFSAEGAFSTDVWDHSLLEAGSPPPASLFKQENPDDKEV